jgi:hypothetical protein
VSSSSERVECPTVKTIGEFVKASAQLAAMSRGRSG